MSEGIRDDLRLRVVVSLVLVLVFLALGIGVFAFTLSLRQEPEKAAGGPPRTVVRVEIARRGPYREQLRGYGLARALRRSRVGAEVTGLVTWLSPNLEAGAEVAEGEELVRLDRRDFVERQSSAQARARQAEAALTRQKIDLASLGRRLEIAKEDFDAAKRELERVRRLVASGVEKRSEFDRQLQAKSQREQAVIQLESRVESSRADLSHADAEVAATEAALAQMSNDLERTVIRAPFAGRIEARVAELGSRVGPGAPLFILIDLSRIEVPVALGASHHGEVKPGAKARIRLSEGGPVAWSGEVARVSPGVSPADRTFLVYLVVQAAPGETPVPPGAFVVAAIDGLVHEDVIAVPRVAFVGDSLYLAETEEGETVVRECRPEVARTLADVALVSGGLEPGKRVVVTNLEQIADGSRVQVVLDDARTPSAPGGDEGR